MWSRARGAQNPYSSESIWNPLEIVDLKVACRFVSRRQTKQARKYLPQSQGGKTRPKKKQREAEGLEARPDTHSGPRFSLDTCECSQHLFPAVRAVPSGFCVALFSRRKNALSFYKQYNLVTNTNRIVFFVSIERCISASGSAHLEAV